MKVLKDAKHPLTLVMVAESEADRILVALLRKSKRVIFHKGASEEIFSEARALSPIPESGERVARRMMDEDPQCKLHKDATKRGCADCLGMVAFSIGPVVSYEAPANYQECEPDMPGADANTAEFTF